jgi:hypothetical protein
MTFRDRTKFSSIQNLYAGVKNIFMDSHPALDFELGPAKPANAHYIGGITLVEQLEKKPEEKHGKGVEMVSERMLKENSAYSGKF